VRGHVVDRDGRGVADADVACDPGDESCRTAEDGAFELAPDASALRLVARKEAYAPSEALALELAPGEVVEGVSLRLRESCRIEGRVLDAGGRPVESAWVGAEGLASTETDASGAFALGDLPPGVQEILAELPNASPQIVRASVDLRPGRAATLELRFDEPDPVLLHGQIRRRGKPLSCWLVLQSSTSRAEGLVGDDGRFEETLAHPGDFVGELWIGGPSGREGRRLELHVPDADEFAFETDFDTLPRIGE
jgi:hypothetical protein